MCFRCGASGDVINFVQQLEHLTFLEAVAHLGIAQPVRPIGPTRRLAQSPPESARPLQQSEKDVLAAALDLYRNRLLHESEALAYLARRGFARDIVEQEHLGYCAGDELVPYLVWRGLPVRAARRVGLLIPGGREHLAGRIVFPEIRQGSPVWFIGRSLHESDDSPRYLGLPRSKPLLGWDTASRDLRGVCLVEGPLIFSRCASGEFRGSRCAALDSIPKGWLSGRGLACMQPWMPTPEGSGRLPVWSKPSGTE